MCQRDDTEDRIAIGGMLKRFTIQLRHLADLDMKEWDLTWSQGHVLHHLIRHNGEMTQKELEREMDISHPTMVGLIQRMESKGFLKTRTCDEDHRKKIVTVTDKALSHQKTMLEHMREKELVMTKDLTQDDVNQLIQILEKVYHNLTEYREERDKW